MQIVDFLNSLLTNRNVQIIRISNNNEDGCFSDDRKNFKQTSQTPFDALILYALHEQKKHGICKTGKT